MGCPPYSFRFYPTPYGRPFMRIFYAFLVLMTAAILLMVPVSEAVYDFRTDLKTDIFTSVTDVDETTDNLTLTNDVYNDDTSTLTILSSESSDVPALAAYGESNHTILVSGLSENTTRTLTVTYDIYSLPGWAGIDAIVSKTNFLWYLALIAFVPLALIAVWRGSH